MSTALNTGSLDCAKAIVKFQANEYILKLRQSEGYVTLLIVALKKFLESLRLINFVIVSHCVHLALVLRKLTLRGLSTITSTGDHEVKLPDSSLRVRPIDR